MVGKYTGSDISGKHHNILRTKNKLPIIFKFHVNFIIAQSGFPGAVFVILSMRLLLPIKIIFYLVKYFGYIPSSEREQSQLSCVGGSMKLCTILTDMDLGPLRIRNKGERDILKITPLYDY